MLSYVMLYYIILYHIILHYILLCSISYYVTFYSIILYHILLITIPRCGGAPGGPAGAPGEHPTPIPSALSTHGDEADFGRVGEAGSRVTSSIGRGCVFVAGDSRVLISLLPALPRRATLFTHPSCLRPNLSASKLLS